MKNVRDDQLKKAICCPFEEFRTIMRKACGENRILTEEKHRIPIGCAIDYEGLEYWADSLEINEIHAKLAEYFGVSKVTSIHADDCDYVGVWIIYKD